MTMHALFQDVPTDGALNTLETPDDSPSGANTDRRRRAASTALGGALLAVGLKRRSLGGAVAASVGGWLVYRGVSGRSRLHQASDAGTATGRGRETETPAEAMEVEQSITIGESPEELYEFWRDPAQLARVVEHFAEVTSAGEDRQRWTVDGPFGRSLSWESQIVEERPGEFLRWKSLEGADLPHEGSMQFRPAPGDRGTEVTLRVRYDPPGGVLGTAAMKRLGLVPKALVIRTLRHFKSLVETGEIPTLEGNPSARGRGDLL